MNKFRFLPLLLLVMYTAFTSFSGKNAGRTSTKPAVGPGDEGTAYLPWLMSRKLTWDDFLCAPQNSGDAVALTSTTLGISYRVVNNQLSYEITCHFSKTRSWGLLKTPYILAHEQGHFDITEIFARRLHQQLQAYPINKKSFKKDISKIYNDVVKGKEAFQEMYDEETGHSRNKKAQREWLEKIDRLLEETERFADYP